VPKEIKTEVDRAFGDEKNKKDALILSLACIKK
jgi:hypothetical protein